MNVSKNLNLPFEMIKLTVWEASQSEIRAQLYFLQLLQVYPTGSPQSPSHDEAHFSGC